ncbi:RhoGEF domain-containing protein, partial [Reticulomyxa filosa]
ILLEEIIKNTSSSHPDFQSLEKALEKIKEVSATVNDRMKEYSRREAVSNIEKRFNGTIFLLEPARQFVMEGILSKIERRDDRDYVFFLFTDCLVYGTQSFVGLKFQNLLPIDLAFDIREPSYQDSDNTAFEVYQLFLYVL